MHDGESTFMGERADNVANFLTFFRVVICDLAGMRRVVVDFYQWKELVFVHYVVLYFIYT